MTARRIGAAATGGLAAVLLAAMLLPRGAAADPLTLGEALAAAVANQPSLRAARHEAEARRAEADSVRGHLLPLLKVDADGMGWESAQGLRVDVSPVAALLNDFQGLLSDATKQQLAVLKRDGLTLPVHDRWTANVNVTVAQPLTQLVKVVAGWRAQRELARASDADEATARRQVELDVSHAFHGMIAAAGILRTAQAAIRQVEAVEVQVQALLEHGVVESNALLKVQVQKADLQRKSFQAEKAVRLATAMLNLQMGRPLGAPIEPVVTDEIPGDAVEGEPLERLQDEAVRSRPELASGRARRVAARLARDVAVGDFLPAISAIATYNHNEGFGDFLKRDQFFGGLVLQWNAWEWGAGWYQIKAAEARSAMAEESVRAGEDKVRLDVEARRLDVEEAGRSLAVARTAAVQARENLRVEQARFDVAETTVTDLLAAQTLSVQADNEVAVADMRLREARLALLSGTGRDLVEATRGR